jgi:hypothetical protein
MKKILFILSISTIFLLGLSSCYKTCEDPMASNYTLKGDCIDATTSVVGNYSGTFLDSVPGVHSTTSQITIQITKVDDSHVQVTASTNAFIGFTAAVSSSSNGYYLTVPSQTSSGATVVGAGTYFGNAADGVYVTATRQITIYTLVGGLYEGFIGVQ